MPRHAQKFGSLNYTIEAQRPQVQAPEKSCRYTPPEKYDGAPQYDRRIFAQDLKQPLNKEFMSLERSMERSVVHVSPEGYECAKSPIVHGPIGNFRPSYSGLPVETEYAPHPGLTREESRGNKRQKMERQSTPPLNPDIASHSGEKIIDLCNGDQDIPDLDQQSDADPKIDEKTSTHHITTHGQDVKDEISMAQILTSLQGGKFAVSNI